MKMRIHSDPPKSKKKEEKRRREAIFEALHFELSDNCAFDVQKYYHQNVLSEPPNGRLVECVKKFVKRRKNDDAKQ